MLTILRVFTQVLTHRTRLIPLPLARRSDEGHVAGLTIAIVYAVTQICEEKPSFVEFASVGRASLLCAIALDKLDNSFGSWR